MPKHSQLESPFAQLDSRDFALVRAVRHNDGSSPILLTFVGRRADPLVQAGLSSTLSESPHQSVAIFTGRCPDFEAIAELFPAIPARIAVQRTPRQMPLLLDGR